MLTLHENVIAPDERARIRDALDAAGWQRSFIADRLRLETATLADPLLAALTPLASAAVGAPLRQIAACWLRLRHGDYQLTKHDARERPPGAHIELIADLSAAATGEAEIFYSDGVVVPQRPGAVAIVARDTALRWQRYLTGRVGTATVVRAILTFVASGDPVFPEAARAPASC